MVERIVTVDLGDDVLVAVEAETIGVELVSDDGGLVKHFGGVSKSIERVSGDVLTAIKNAGPDKATVELGFGLAIEEGKLIALFGKGKGEASIKVTLEWSAKPGSAEEKPAADG